MQEKSPVCFKIALVGETKTGKTQIMRRFIFNKFNPAYQTAFINFEIKKFTDSKGRTFKVQIWDACGQDHAYAISYVKTVNVIGIVVDGSHTLGASNLSKWIEKIKKIMAKSVFICLIISKIDLIEFFDKTYKNKFVIWQQSTNYQIAKEV